MTLLRLYDYFIECGMVTTDSRHCPEGSMFFALKGSNFNGNAFAEAALEKGCRYAVVDEEQYVNGNPRIFLVKNVLETLQKLAKLHRHEIGIPIIGITGTNGKTTTKELIAAVLRKKYQILATEGNLNNQIGVPLTLLKLNEDLDMAVVEMGASHPGDIKELVDIADPDGKLKTFLVKNTVLLTYNGLWMEDPAYTKGWIHLQIYAPKSMRRFFIP